MDELADMVEAALSEYAAGNARDLLESPIWVDVRRGIKDLVTMLELNGRSATAARVDREYLCLSEALREAASEDPAAKFGSKYALWDMAKEFPLTLRALCRFRGEIDPQYRQKQADNPPAERRKSKRGRKRLDKDEAKRRVDLVRTWQRAKEAGVSEKDFCEDAKISLKDLSHARNWMAQRHRRGDSLA